ncbi:metal ABC transporter ATP-binding protein [Salinicola avicenniae]|uniref:metal ABC transporter ATP-binding protein n=1 Tax=Salinicola avicenniae TaxID=2916836 RepID=UPI0020743E9F|nr:MULTISPECIES: metal ABC transporter ATP-binding protein [unclassified Salinicola]
MKPVLTLESLSLAQGDRLVLENVDGEFTSGSITALVGPNGAGKSTLVQGIMGVLKPIRGRVHCAVPNARRAWLPQQLALDLSFPMSVEELVMSGCWPTHGSFRRYGGTEYRRGQAIMHRLGLQAFEHRPLGELSGGQRQRALLGRTLMQEAQLLLLDEPFANVDAATVDILIDVLRDMAREGVSIIIVLHDHEQLMRLADRVLLLDRGHGTWTTPAALGTASPTAGALFSTAPASMTGEQAS